MRGRHLSLIVLLVLGVGCGLIADKDGIKIAKLGGKWITRGDLFRVIREMPDDERPNIRNRSDLLRVLNNYIDEEIKVPLGEEVSKQFEAQGKTLISRDVAKQQYFKQHEEDNFAVAYQVTDPKALNMTQAQLDATKQEIDLGIDRIYEKIKGDAAVAYRAAEAIKDKKLSVTPEEFDQEYRLRKDDLKKLEWMKFRGIRFPAEEPDSEAKAAAVRKRLDTGEKFDDIEKENPKAAIESEIENNPGLAKFKGFWLNASEAKPGDIIGPVFLPEYQVMVSAEGKSGVRNMPAAYIVFEVLDHRPERALTLDEAKPSLAPSILVVKMMQLLREQNGVEIYEKKLPDPAMFSDKFDQSGVKQF